MAMPARRGTLETLPLQAVVADLRLSDQMYRAEYKLRLIYEELEKKGVKLPMAQRWSLRDSEVLAQHFVQGKSDGSEEETNL
eukprot:CAMPEP_0117438748 /NCGR_PEP_ID=MMETSP0759-20121206/2214_1 /TAXON_ID=63605 /ORGANISM="Percolomonas cosmopolitus, Strain WS" /LENGTH=81 /DNA_ID=CAMNT_0005230451 /DNA_START=1055 /DNA_END=1301 /DNA_ORIENTATION=+